MKKLIMTSITAVVVIVVLAGTLIPILEDATATEDTFTNEGYYDMVYTEDSSVSLSWDHTNPHVVTINTTEVALPESPTQALTIVCGDQWLVRYTGTEVQMYTGAGSHIDATVAAETDATLVASGGSATWTTTAESSNTATVSYTSIYYASNDGPYVMKLSDTPAYVNGDSAFYGQGRTAIVGVSLMLRVEGTVDDGATVTNIFTSSNISIGEPTVHKTAVNGYEDLYLLEKITFDVTNSSTTTTSTATYSYFLVPAEVTAERTVHFTDGENAIFNAIPVMIIIALLLGVVALVLRSRMD